MAIYDRNRWLILAPHIDDMELGMGGWIARAKKEFDPYIVVAPLALGSFLALTKNGNVSQYEVSKEQRIAEHKKAEKILGVDHSDLASPFEENKLMDVPRAKLVAYIELLIRRHKPDELFIPLPSFNQDHTALYEACIIALRPNALSLKVPEVWAYEYPGVFWGNEPSTLSKCYVRLSDEDLKVKLIALEQHASQSMTAGGFISTSSVRSLAELRGSECGAQYAEAYYLIRWVY